MREVVDDGFVIVVEIFCVVKFKEIKMGEIGYVCWNRILLEIMMYRGNWSSGGGIERGGLGYGGCDIFISNVKVWIKFVG